VARVRFVARRCRRHAARVAGESNWKVSVAWVAQMQEAGIPITYAYIADAHDGHGTSGNIHFAYGPGESGYVQQLQNHDRAFQKFFDRLAADGIDKSNTLFAFTVDEGDHFVGDAPTPVGCDGVTTPCQSFSDAKAQSLIAQGQALLDQANGLPQ
jgi:hypothetical protein